MDYFVSMLNEASNLYGSDYSKSLKYTSDKLKAKYKGNYTVIVQKNRASFSAVRMIYVTKQ